MECKKASIDGMTHTKCKRPWGGDRLISIWEYNGIIRQSLLKLKYNFAFDIAKELSEKAILEIEKQKIIFPEKAILIPIPLHKRRQNWRGFNQTEEIGKLLASKFKWRFSSKLITRKEYRTPQTELKKSERKENIKGVFHFNLGSGNNAIKNAEIIIFDDVYTTGSTTKEVITVLKRNGFRKVIGLTIAR